MTSTARAEEAIAKTDEILDRIMSRRRSREVAVTSKDRAALFQRMCSDHQEKQQENPFSEAGGVVKRKLDKNDPDYGKPLAGSKTEKRGQAANEHINKNMKELLEVIYDMALNDPNCPGPECFVKFGPLFDYYVRISDILVGLLMRARKHGFVSFEGEMLYQRRDDHKKITLMPAGMKLINKP